MWAEPSAFWQLLMLEELNSAVRTSYILKLVLVTGISSASRYSNPMAAEWHVKNVLQVFFSTLVFCTAFSCVSS